MTATTVSSSPSTAIAKPRLRYLGGTRYLLESRSCPGTGRQVDALTLTCSCPAGKQGRRCYHLAWVLQYEAWRRHQLAKAAVVA